MTWNELVDTYGKYEVHFDGYYKHKFTYVSEEYEGVRLQVVIGDGDPQTVYKESLSPFMFLEHSNPESVSILENGTWTEVYTYE